MEIIKRLLLALFVGCSLCSANTEKPNVVLLLADDLGYGELGCYGQDIIQTPRLDELARKGMRFEQFYAGSSVCSPSRCVLMTGKHAGNATIRGNKGIYENGEARRVALRPDEQTLGELFRGAGYQTTFVGKWHLDIPDDPSTWAFARGFDFAIQEQWGVAADGSSFDARYHLKNGTQDTVFYDYEKYDCLDEFRTGLMMDFLDQKDDEKPFFMFFSYRAPHGKEHDIGNRDQYSDRGWNENKRRHAAVVTLLDREIGRLLDRLEADGDLENTLILFTSDNGPHREGGRGYNPDDFNSSGGFRGIKRDMYEGGIRVPAIAYWKNRIKPGSVSVHLAAFYDVMPTFAEAAGIEFPEQTDGISFLPELLGHEQQKHDFLYFELLRVIKTPEWRQAIRKGDLKLVRHGTDATAELYDLRADRGEQNNMAAEHPEKAQQLESLMRQSHRDALGFVLEKPMDKKH